jgi:hypothetical protein
VSRRFRVTQHNWRQIWKSRGEASRDLSKVTRVNDRAIDRSTGLPSVSRRALDQQTDRRVWIVAFIHVNPGVAFAVRNDSFAILESSGKEIGDPCRPAKVVDQPRYWGGAKAFHECRAARLDQHQPPTRGYGIRKDRGCSFGRSRNAQKHRVPGCGSVQQTG